MKIYQFGGFLLSACFVFASCGLWGPEVPPAQPGDRPDGRDALQPGPPGSGLGEGRAEGGTRGLGTASPARNTTPDPDSFGVVKCDREEEDFHRHIFNFISAKEDPQHFIDAQQMTINCRDFSNHTGGMFIRGRILFGNGGTFNPNGNNGSLVVSSESYLEIFIINTNGRNITGNPDTGAKGIRLRYDESEDFASSPFVTNSGGIDLVFSNSIREVMLTGRVEPHEDGEFRFSGDFHYENKADFQNSHSISFPSGRIGHFVIRACRFFDCSS